MTLSALALSIQKKSKEGSLFQDVHVQKTKTLDVQQKTKHNVSLMLLFTLHFCVM